jgi:hypothetical protein
LLTLLTPNDHYSGRTAPLTSKRCILYIYSTNIDAEYFKHGMYGARWLLMLDGDGLILLDVMKVDFTAYFILSR